MNKIAIILARQNSKGIPLKNLQPVGGISLLGRAIQSAIESGVFTHIVVSTDGELIVQEAQKYPDVLIIKRPDELANDTASSISGVIHALDTLKQVYNVSGGVVCLLQPTSPLRTGKHIQESWALFEQQQFSGCVISACGLEQHPYKCLVKTEQDYEPVHLLTDLEAPRQQLPKAYAPNGAIYWNDVDTLKHHQRFFNKLICLYEMNEQDSLDIDRPNDLIKANEILYRVKNAEKL